MNETQPTHCWRERLVHLVTWDGMLPAVSLLSPWLLRRVLGFGESFVTVVSVIAVPIVMACIRTGVAERKLNAMCKARPPVWRQLVLAIAIVLLLLFEAMANVIGCSAKPIQPMYWIAGGLYALYVLSMAICLLPQQHPKKYLNQQRHSEFLEFGEVKIPRH